MPGLQSTSVWSGGGGGGGRGDFKAMQSFKNCFNKMDPVNHLESTGNNLDFKKFAVFKRQTIPEIKEVTILQYMLEKEYFCLKHEYI